METWEYAVNSLEEVYPYSLGILIEWKQWKEQGGEQ